MHRILRHSLTIALAATLLSACSKLPDHARYIPKDAVAVAGINIRGLGKKIAWNMITGSKLFKEMQKRIPEKSTKDAMDGIEKSGIDLSNTIYVYVKPDTRFKNGNRITGLVPLSDAGSWEAYVKKSFPQVEIKQHGDRKEASLGRDMYVGWSNKLLIIINVMAAPDYGMPGDDTQPAPKPMEDMAGLSAELDNAFGVTNDNSIINNIHFTDVETAGHDITFWLNYGLLMDEYGNVGNTGVSLSGALWKDAAFTSGFDFKKGKITGDMQYYLPDSMKAIGEAFGAENVDKDMLDRLPNQHMDAVLAMHISPKGVKMLLEKMGILGLANTALATQNMTVDYVLDAFTGDISFVMNDFSLHMKQETDSFMGQAVVHQVQTPTLSMAYVMKINKKENFRKLFDLAKDNGLQPVGTGYAMPLDDKDTIYAQANDQYMIVSNKNPYAEGFLQGTFKTEKMPEAAATQVAGHPFAFYLDMQQMLKNVDAGINQSAQDSAMITESRKLLNNISLTGGAFKNSAISYHLDINFTNTEENSIIELMDYGMKMSDANKTARQ